MKPSFVDRERRWRDRWERDGTHRADLNSAATRRFVHDAAPFPNGPLHLGHVRTYVLGDLCARYSRKRGDAVLYTTGFDAFGLPIELAARAGVRRAIWSNARSRR